jgi:hypothetical protein
VIEILGISPLDPIDHPFLIELKQHGMGMTMDGLRAYFFRFLIGNDRTGIFNNPGAFADGSPGENAPAMNLGIANDVVGLCGHEILV